MSYTLQNFLDDVQYRVNDASGGNADNVSVTNYLNEGLRRIRRKFDLPTSENVTQLKVFQGVYEYAPPTGFSEYIALNKQWTLDDDLNFKRVDEKEFWRNYNGDNMVSISRNKSNTTLLIAYQNDQLSNPTVNACDTYNGNGTFVASGDANTVASDTLYYREGSGSVKFNITTSTGTAVLTNSDMSHVDLSGSSVAKVGMMTLYVYLPSATNYTSFTLRFGTDASNYYQSTVTTQINGGVFVEGWNTLGFDWSTATTTGTPTDSSIGYLQLSIALPLTMANQTGLRIDSFVMHQPLILNLHWVSDYLVVDGTTGALKETFASATDSSSYFLCPSEFTDWLLYHTLENVFMYLVRDSEARNLNSIRLQELEQELATSYPSRRELTSYSYIETDNFSDQLN
jgi:hypothetical protein